MATLLSSAHVNHYVQALDRTPDTQHLLGRLQHLLVQVIKVTSGYVSSSIAHNPSADFGPVAYITSMVLIHTEG